jgi:hypothetical protein
MPDLYSCELCDVWVTPEYCVTCEKSKCPNCGDCEEASLCEEENK